MSIDLQCHPLIASYFHNQLPIMVAEVCRCHLNDWYTTLQLRSISTYHTLRKKWIDQSHSMRRAFFHIVFQVQSDRYCSCRTSNNQHPMKHKYSHLWFRNQAKQDDPHMFEIRHLINKSASFLQTNQRH